MKPFTDHFFSGLIVLVLAMFANQAAQAQNAYRWVDKEGKVHYTDQPPPPAAAKTVQQQKLKASVISTSGLSYSMKKTSQNFPVTLYTSANCEKACKDARAFLTHRSIPFSEIVVKTNEDIAAAKKATGIKEMMTPLLLVGDKPQQGYEPGSWEKQLEAAGYPMPSTPAGERSNNTDTPR